MTQQRCGKNYIGGVRKAEGGWEAVFLLEGKDKEDQTDGIKSRVSVSWGGSCWQRSGATEHKIFPSELNQTPPARQCAE